MKIGIVPKFQLTKKKEIEFSIEENIFHFLKKIFKKPSFKILTSTKNVKLDLIIITGGNDLDIFSKKKDDLKRSIVSKYFLRLSIKKKLPLVGICYGAQLIAHYFKSKIQKKKKHVGKHYIFLRKHYYNLAIPKKIIVNSYHDFSITKLSKELITLSEAKDKTIESFTHKKFKMLGIMWHPERYASFRKIDKSYFKKLIWTS